MALEIIWSDRAKENFDRIVNFIEENWTEKEVRNFIQRTERTLSKIPSYPKMYKESKRKGIRKGLITKHTSFYYKIGRRQIKLITFQDNRENPKKLKL